MTEVAGTIWIKTSWVIRMLSLATGSVRTGLESYIPTLCSMGVNR